MGTLLDIGQKPYNHYGAYLRAKYEGKRVFKIIVDGNFTCPNRDGSKGYGGCAYCNVDSFTPDSARRQPDIREQVEEGIKRAVNGYGAEKFVIYSNPIPIPMHRFITSKHCTMKRLALPRSMWSDCR